MSSPHNHNSMTSRISNQSNDIFAWLHHIPLTDGSQLPPFEEINTGNNTRSNKRRKLGFPDRLLSPPGSSFDRMASQTSSTASRKRKADGSASGRTRRDKNQTPRANENPLDTDDSVSLSSASQSQCESTRSTRSGVNKIDSILELDPAGLEWLPFRYVQPGMPPSLVELIKDLDKIQRGENVVPRELKV